MRPNFPTAIDDFNLPKSLALYPRRLISILHLADGSIFILHRHLRRSVTLLSGHLIEGIRPWMSSNQLLSKRLWIPLGSARHQFLIFRLFSLAGIMPMGGYVVLHLATNASVLGGPATFQSQVDRIHSLGILLPFVEWTFIFLPILFHAAMGFYIIAGGLPNVGSYPYSGNVRYTLQRATGMLAIAFILFHLWQLHHYGKALGGGDFDAEHATSSTALALSPVYWKIVYVIGTLSVVYHLSNGIWTFGITWGLWTSDGASDGPVTSVRPSAFCWPPSAWARCTACRPLMCRRPKPSNPACKKRTKRSMAKSFNRAILLPPSLNHPKRIDGVNQPWQSSVYWWSEAVWPAWLQR